MLPNSGKLLALDLGTRRTGIAVSDLGQKVAFARPELEHASDAELLQQLRVLLKQESIVGVLVGMPLKLDGKESVQTKRVRETVRGLETLELPILPVDERWSSHFAENLHGFFTKEHYHDSRAAQIFLETYLRGSSK